jgi:hypothetical protein
MTSIRPSAEFLRRRRNRNLALGGILLALIVLFYLGTLARLGFWQ